jgi:hypothetical protein
MSLDPAGTSACATEYQPFVPHITQKLKREFSVTARVAEAAVGNP